MLDELKKMEEKLKAQLGKETNHGPQRARVWKERKDLGMKMLKRSKALLSWR